MGKPFFFFFILFSDISWSTILSLSGVKELSVCKKKIYICVYIFTEACELSSKQQTSRFQLHELSQKYRFIPLVLGVGTHARVETQADIIFFFLHPGQTFLSAQIFFFYFLQNYLNLADTFFEKQPQSKINFKYTLEQTKKI